MIDPETGDLAFEQPAASFGPRTMRNAVLLSPWAAAGEPGDRAAPTRLEGRYLSGGVAFGVVLRFEGRRLAAAELWNDDPKFGTSWDDFSREQELLRKATHDEWLTACLGDRRTFPWGTARAYFDERGGSNTIVVEYAPPGAGGGRFTAFMVWAAVTAPFVAGVVGFGMYAAFDEPNLGAAALCVMCLVAAATGAVGSAVTLVRTLRAGRVRRRSRP